MSDTDKEADENVVFTGEMPLHVIYSLEETRSWCEKKAAAGKCREENDMYDILHRQQLLMKERGTMSRQHRLIQLPLVGMILLCLLVGVYLVVWKRFSKGEPAAPIRKHSVGTPAEDTLKYWTADKMRKAKAAKMPHVTTGKQEKQQPRRPRG
jgi:hypothetical protein